MVIGCCDSRVAPEAIFDAGPGELFVIRNVGDLVPPYAPDNHFHGTSAALEYAVMALKVAHLVVLGHAQCGGVRAYAESVLNPDAPPLSHGDFIGNWIKLLAPAVERAGARRPTSTIRIMSSGSNSSRSSSASSICAASPWCRCWSIAVTSLCTAPISA